jgi:prevent-host-death family protein
MTNCGVSSMAQFFSEVASFDAKTRLPELLREAQAGQRFTITVRGKPVADLVPSVAVAGSGTAASIAAMRAMPRVKGLDAETVQAMIAEGRR